MMFDWNDGWSLVWSFLCWIFALIAFLISLGALIADLYRDHKLNGRWTTPWIVFLVVVPFLTCSSASSHAAPAGRSARMEAVVR